jgi:hypothetical protein
MKTGFEVFVHHVVHWLIENKDLLSSVESGTGIANNLLPHVKRAIELVTTTVRARRAGDRRVRYYDALRCKVIERTHDSERVRANFGLPLTNDLMTEEEANEYIGWLTGTAWAQD